MIFLFNIGLFVFTFLPNLFKLGTTKNHTGDGFNRLLLFAGAFLFAVCLSHLIPESIIHYNTSWTGILIVFGFFAQYIIQHYSHGADHGHTCHHMEDKKYIWSLFTAMALHSFFEGLPLSTGLFSLNSLIPIYIAIALHKIPSALIIMNVFYNATKSRRQSILVTMLFSMITPLAALIGNFLSKNISVFTDIVPYIIPVVAGSLLQIATTIFFEAAGKHHDIKYVKWFFIITGAFLGSLTGLFHIH